MNDLLSERQTAKLVKLKPKVLRMLREHGFGPLWVKAGGRIRYKAASVGEYVAASTEAFDLQDLSD